MAKQTFTSGQVLTAAQMTSLQANDYNQTVSAKTASYVLVASDAGTTLTMNSASNTTVTVNTSLFTAGDTLRIQNLNGGGTCTVTAGTATVTTSGSLVIPSWGGGTLYFTSASAAVWFPNTYGNGMTQIVPETSFSAVTTVTKDGVFTSAYTNYLVMINATASAGENFFYQLRSGGVSTNSGYGNQYINAGGTSLTTTRTTAQTTATIGTVRSVAQTAMPLYIFAPQLAQWTSAQNSYLDPIGTTTFGAGNFWSVQTTTTQFDGIVFGTFSAVTITGTYSIYGMNK
jgi:hypothetical protein